MLINIQLWYKGLNFVTALIFYMTGISGTWNAVFVPDFVCSTLKLVMQFEKNTFVFFEKNCFLWRKKHDLRKKHWKSVFFCFFFYNKLCIKEKRKVVLLIWGPGDPVCPREVKITPPTPSCSPLCVWELAQLGVTL